MASKMAPSWRTIDVEATLAEFVGTFFFLFLVITSVTAWGGTALAPIGIATVFGITIFAMEIAHGETSGGHFNSAVSLAVWIMGEMNVLQMICYWIAQIAGATAGAAFARLCVGDPVYQANNTGVNAVGLHHSDGRAFLAEIIATMFFVMVVLQTADKKKNPQGSAWAPLAIGFALLVCHLALVPIDGCSVNPARSLGAAIAATGKLPKAAWSGMWIFVFGPFIGAAIAGFVKRVVVPVMEVFFEKDEGGRESTPAGGRV